MNGNFECRVCIKGSNEECKNFSNSYLSELERMNNFCCSSDFINGEEVSELSIIFGTGRHSKKYIYLLTSGAE